MTGTARSNYPGGRRLTDLHRLPPVGDDVRELQRELWAAAKQSPERRFHALHDRIYRRDVLMEAWKRVRSNRGAAGVDRVTLADVESYGVDRMLEDLRRDLQAGSYRPAPVRRRDIPKPAGGVRPLGIPTVRDRVVQAAAKIICEPIFEADFLPCSYGYRPNRSATDALEVIRWAFPKGFVWAVEFDIADFFGSIDHDVVMRLVQRRVSDRRTLKLIRAWLGAGVLADGRHQQTVAGTPQGGVISPLLANIVLHELDRVMGGIDAVFVRYADDGIVLCRTQTQAERALALVRDALTAMGLALHADKTKVVDLREGREGFDFLGCHFHARMSGPLWERGIRRYYLHRWPSQRSMGRYNRKLWMHGLKMDAAYPSFD
jgi:RNA-directed DNA polymerase